MEFTGAGRGWCETAGESGLNLILDRSTRRGDYSDGDSGPGGSFLEFTGQSLVDIGHLHCELGLGLGRGAGGGWVRGRGGAGGWGVVGDVRWRRGVLVFAHFPGDGVSDEMRWVSRVDQVLPKDLQVGLRQVDAGTYLPYDSH